MGSIVLEFPGTIGYRSVPGGIHIEREISGTLRTLGEHPIRPLSFLIGLIRMAAGFWNIEFNGQGNSSMQYAEHGR
ncbi:hypothetical protein BDBG_17711 [Blastomyces gilchristii SLH14081]|uniref:Uncharacterized protein n=1 Tax=Blastomyces gilchristii (strain SLH14081) TaxID=559298 RepID=A0A179V0M0_BLAGS|nr:uncharacterized protein BDBG_17711 [Blastomyces gilchristii SLH14081]OAT12871.1 hypothetical protein BDBG_17711 [Blastomyces gilchristii SLH14081]